MQDMTVLTSAPPPPPAETQYKYKVGTLKYTLAGLAIVCGWMLVAFCFLLYLYFQFKKHGGPHNYVAPDPEVA